jgi:hypothetical protein
MDKDIEKHDVEGDVSNICISSYARACQTPRLRTTMTPLCTSFAVFVHQVCQVPTHDLLAVVYNGSLYLQEGMRTPFGAASGGVG